MNEQNNNGSGMNLPQVLKLINNREGNPLTLRNAPSIIKIP